MEVSRERHALVQNIGDMVMQIASHVTDKPADVLAALAYAGMRTLVETAKSKDDARKVLGSLAKLNERSLDEAWKIAHGDSEVNTNPPEEESEPDAAEPQTEQFKI